MAEFQEHAHEVRHFLIVSSVQPELARARDSRDTSLDAFRATHDRIESMIRDRQWQALREFVSGLPEQTDILISDTRSDAEVALGELWQRFSGFGVAVASSVVWLAEPQIYYLLLWKD
jgi:Lhr-like helicase